MLDRALRIRDRLRFWCLGCDDPHEVTVEGERPWGWNNNLVRVTLTPSVKVTRPRTDYCCHSFVVDGSIQFLSDCTHALAGTTVELPGRDSWRHSNELDTRLMLREARDVPETLHRDAIVRRIAELRASVALDINTIDHWNRTHPEEVPISTEFERSVIEWCDGKGPMPQLPR